jgi:hypothetical protein
MVEVTCMIDVASVDRWTVYKTVKVPLEKVGNVLDQFESDMKFLGWKHKTITELQLTKRN